MKKRIFVLLIALTVALASLIPCANAEQAQDTPYGIPLYSAPEEVDLAAVFEGNGIKHILDQVGTIYLKQKLTQSGSFKYSATEDVYFIKDIPSDQYLRYDITEGDMGETRGLVSFDPSNPFQCSICTGGSKQNILWTNDEAKVRAEWNKVAPFPFDPTICKFEITSTDFVDGLYYIEFVITEIGEADPPKFTDCYVKIDPETSLLCEFRYKASVPGTTIERNGVAEYGLEESEIPNYQDLLVP